MFKSIRNKNRLPWGPALPLLKDTLGVPGASWRCDTHSTELQSHPDRRAWELPRVCHTSPPPSLPAPLSRRRPLPLLHPSCGPALSGRCRPRSSAPGWPWAPSASTSSCRWDTRAWPSSCSRTAADRPGRSCGCTWAPRGPWRSRSRRGRTAPLPAWSLSERKPPAVEGPKLLWGSGRRRAFERKNAGAAPWQVPVGCFYSCKWWLVTESGRRAPLWLQRVHRVIWTLFMSNQGYRSTGTRRTGLLHL